MSTATRFVWEIHHPYLSNFISLWKQTMVQCNDLVTQELSISQVKAKFTDILQYFNAELIQICEEFNTLCIAASDSTIYYSHVNSDKYIVTRDDMTDQLLQLISYKAIFQLISIIYLDFHDHISNHLLYWFHSCQPIPPAYDQYMYAIQYDIPLKVGHECGTPNYWRCVEALLMSGRIPETVMLITAHKVILEETIVHSYRISLYDLLLAIIFSCPSYQNENLALIKEEYGFTQSLSRFLQDRRAEELSHRSARSLMKKRTKKSSKKTAVTDNDEDDQSPPLPEVKYDDTVYSDLTLDNFVAWQGLVTDILHDLQANNNKTTATHSAPRSDMTGSLSLLQVLSGDLDIIVGKCWNWMQLFFARLLFVDPLLDKEDTLRLYHLCHEVFVSLDSPDGDGSEGMGDDDDDNAVPIQYDQNKWKIYYDRDTHHDDYDESEDGMDGGRPHKPHSILDSTSHIPPEHLIAASQQFPLPSSAESHANPSDPSSSFSSHPFTDRPTAHAEPPLVFVVVSAIQPVLHVIMTLGYTSTLPALYAFYSHSLFNSVIGLFFSIRLGVSDHIERSLPLLQAYVETQKRTGIDMDGPIDDEDVDELLDLLVPPTTLKLYPLIDFDDASPPLSSHITGFIKSLPEQHSTVLAENVAAMDLLFLRHFNTYERWFYTCLEEYIFQFKQYSIYNQPLDQQVATTQATPQGGNDGEDDDDHAMVAYPLIGQHLNHPIALKRYQQLLANFLKTPTFHHIYDWVVTLLGLDFLDSSSSSPHATSASPNGTTALVQLRPDTTDTDSNFPHPLPIVNRLLATLAVPTLHSLDHVKQHFKDSFSPPIWPAHSSYPVSLAQFKQHLFFSTISRHFYSLPSTALPTLSNTIISFNCEFQLKQMCLYAIQYYYMDVLFHSHLHITTQLRLLCKRYHVPYVLGSDRSDDGGDHDPNNTQYNHHHHHHHRRRHRRHPQQPSLDQMLLWVHRLKCSHLTLSVFNVCLTYAYSDNIPLSAFVRQQLHIFWSLRRAYWPCLPSTQSLNDITHLGNARDGQSDGGDGGDGDEDDDANDDPSTTPHDKILSCLLSTIAEMTNPASLDADILTTFDLANLRKIEELLKSIDSNSNPDGEVASHAPSQPSPFPTINEEPFIRLLAGFDLLWILQKKLQVFQHHFTHLQKSLNDAARAQAEAAHSGSRMDLSSLSSASSLGNSTLFLSDSLLDAAAGNTSFISNDDQTSTLEGSRHDSSSSSSRTSSQTHQQQLQLHQHLIASLSTKLSLVDINLLKQLPALFHLACLLCDAMLAVAPPRLLKLLIAETLSIHHLTTNTVRVIIETFHRHLRGHPQVAQFTCELAARCTACPASLAYRLQSAFHTITSTPSILASRFFILPNMVASHFALPPSLNLPTRISSPGSVADPSGTSPHSLSSPSQSSDQNKLKVFFNPTNSPSEIGSTIYDTGLITPKPPIIHDDTPLESDVTSSNGDNASANSIHHHGSIQTYQLVVGIPTPCDDVVSHETPRLHPLDSFEQQSSSPTPTIISVLDRIRIEEHILSQNISAILSTYIQRNHHLLSFSPASHGS